MLSLVVLGMTLFIQPSVNRFVASFVRYDMNLVNENIILNEGEVLPPIEKINPKK